jgi:hypothetical protein
MFPVHFSRIIEATMPMAVPSILIESIDCGDALDLGEPAVKTTDARGGNGLETGHCILVNASCEAMQMEM